MTSEAVFARSSASGRPRSVDDAYGNLHAKAGGGVSDEAAPERQGLPGVPSHRDANEIAVADDAVGRIEIDPSGTRQVDLQPGMGRATAKRVRRLDIRHEDIAADEARGEAKRPNSLDHEQGEVATGAAAAPQGFARRLHAWFGAAPIGELLADADRHRTQQADGADRAGGRQEARRPAIDVSGGGPPL